jgi:hypothetical protein
MGYILLEEKMTKRRRKVLDIYKFLCSSKKLSGIVGDKQRSHVPRIE